MTRSITSRGRLLACAAVGSLLMHGLVAAGLDRLGGMPRQPERSAHFPVEVLIEHPFETGAVPPAEGREPRLRGADLRAGVDTSDGLQHPPLGLQQATSDRDAAGLGAGPADETPPAAAAQIPLPVSEPFPAAGAAWRGESKRRDRDSAARKAGQPPPLEMEPDPLPTAAVPPRVGGDSEAIRYRIVVLGLLEKAKQFPRRARQRGARGIAVVGFSLDAAGRLAASSLLRSSGDAALDAESLAVVRRAAPFPPPPRGAERRFSIDIAFGTGR